VDKEFSACHQQRQIGYDRGMPTTARVACSGGGAGHWGWSKDLDHVEVNSRKQKKDLIIVHRLSKIYLRSNVVTNMISVTHPLVDR
jgi:hypothetical protein